MKLGAGRASLRALLERSGGRRPAGRRRTGRGRLPSRPLALAGALRAGFCSHHAASSDPQPKAEPCPRRSDENAARREALPIRRSRPRLPGVGACCGGRASGSAVGGLPAPGSRVILFLLLLVTAIALNLAGLFERPRSAPARQRRTGAFATGALAAFVATPCTGPFMARLWARPDLPRREPLRSSRPRPRPRSALPPARLHPGIASAPAQAGAVDAFRHILLCRWR